MGIMTAGVQGLQVNTLCLFRDPDNIQTEFLFPRNYEHTAYKKLFTYWYSLIIYDLEVEFTKNIL